MPWSWSMMMCQPTLYGPSIHFPARKWREKSWREKRWNIKFDNCFGGENSTYHLKNMWFGSAKLWISWTHNRIIDFLSLITRSIYRHQYIMRIMNVCVVSGPLITSISLSTVNSQSSQQRAPGGIMLDSGYPLSSLHSHHHASQHTHLLLLIVWSASRYHHFYLSHTCPAHEMY